MSLNAQIVYKSFSSVPDYFVLCEKGILRVVQEGPQTDHAIGEFIVLQGVLKAGVLFASDIELAPEENEKKLSAQALVWENALLAVQKPAPLLPVPALKTMASVFQEAAEYVQRAVIRMQPIVVRFDEDTDGITSALYLHRLVEHFVQKACLPFPKTHFRPYQAEAPIFENKHFKQVEDVAEDFAKKPLLVLLDHGGNQESFPALSAAKGAGFDLMLVDHHPPWKPSLDLFDRVVHPAQHGAGSELNTGLLMYHLACSVYTAPKDWAYFSMQGDRCPFALDRFFKEPVVLDYVAAKTWPLKKYGELLNDKDQVAYLYERCLRLRKIALENAIKHRRVQTFKDVAVQWLDISYLTAEYPPKGGVVQGLHEHFEKQGPLLTAGYDKERLIFRLNGGAESAGFAANAFIAELKNRTGLVASGGGHARAASLRLKPGKLAAVLDLLEKKFKDTFGQD